MNIRSLSRQIDAIKRELPSPDPADEFQHLSDDELDDVIATLTTELRAAGDEEDEEERKLTREIEEQEREAAKEHTR